MKITQIAAATLLPATAAGIVLSAMPLAQAAPVAPAPAHAVHHAVAAKTVRPRQVRHHRHHSHATVNHGPSDTTATPAQDGQAASTPTQPAAATASQPLTAGMSSFEQCVAWHESGDNPTASSSGLFGILPATWAQLGYSGTAGQASVAQQKIAFQQLYAKYGTSPWAPYDGC